MTVKRAVIYIVACTAFMGIGAGMAFALLIAEDPSIIVEEKWRVVTTAPPVTYLPETPFHIDRKVICDPYVPPTTSTTSQVTTTTAIKTP